MADPLLRHPRRAHAAAVVDAAPADRFFVDPDHVFVRLPPLAGKGVEEFLPPVAGDAGDADDLAGMDRQIDVGERGGEGVVGGQRKLVQNEPRFDRTLRPLRPLDLGALGPTIMRRDLGAFLLRFGGATSLPRCSIVARLASAITSDSR